MYQTIHYDHETNLIHLIDDKKGYQRFPYRKYAYKLDSKGNYLTLDGKKVSRVTKWTEEEEADGMIFEADVSPILRTLLDLYGDEDHVSENHNIVYLDIEVDSANGNSEPDEANNEITAISFYTDLYKKEFIFLLDKGSTVQPSQTDVSNVYVFDNEEELLEYFLKIYKKHMPTILVGWNSEQYDIIYICNRINKVLGEDYVSDLSPFKHVKWDQRNHKYSIAGVSCLDYMILYKKLSINESSSYALDYICKAELGHGKIEYDGSLDDLYKTDINKFIEYNVNDVRLIVELEEKLKYLDIAIGFCHDCHVPYESIFSTSGPLDGAALVFLKRAGIVAPTKKPPHKLIVARKHAPGENKLIMNNTISESLPKSGILKVWKSKSKVIKVEYTNYKSSIFELKEELAEEILPTFPIKLELIGAFVKVPTPARYEWLYDLDLASLYPSIIMTLNISPETKIGRILNWNVHDYYADKIDKYRVQLRNGKEKYFDKAGITELITTNKYSVAANGTFYRTDKKGFLPSILERWFAERSQYKKLRDEAYENGDMVKYKIYEAKQYTKKIQLNSFYGVLALASFRFYDIDNAEAVTSTGQSTLFCTQNLINQCYNNILKTKDIDYVTYCDTDSAFVSSLPIINTYTNHINLTDDELIEETKKVATLVQNYINKNYPKFTEKYLFTTNCKLKIKQENIASAAVWKAKKRYAQWIVYKDGLRVNELDVKGIEIVRSDFPKLFQGFMSEVLIKMIRGKQREEINNDILTFKKTIKQQPLNMVMYSTGVNISDYDKNRPHIFRHVKGAPVHVKSALNYNDMLKYYNLNTKPVFTNTKIKWGYLKNNELGITELAMLGYNDPKIIEEFVEKYLDHDMIFEKGIVNKIQEFFDIFGWGQIILNDNVSKFFNF